MSQQQEETCFVRSDDQPIPGMKRFSHQAMATTFEILIVHPDERYARQAAAAAFDEVDRLEDELSRFRENTDITRINNLPAHQPLAVGLDVFECLQASARMYVQTNGAFDVTVGSLVNCWRGQDGSPRTPSPEELEQARLHTGMNLVELDEQTHSVQLSASPVRVDLGGVGKGYAVDRVANLLGEWSIETALVSGGYSSVLAMEAPAGTKGWPLTLSDPADHQHILARPELRAGALSGSGVQKGGHIINPRTGRPAQGRRATWSAAPDATTADALSTVFMIMDLDEIERYCSEHTGVLALIILENEGHKQKDTILHFGRWGRNVLRK